MAEKRDYSPVTEPSSDAESRRERRLFWTIFAGAHAFWLYAVLLAGVILLVIYLAGGFGEGGGERGG
jgi:hypothetical protein